MEQEPNLSCGEKKPRPFHLLKMTIRNFKSIEFAQVDANGGHVVITGKNASGKTSTADALRVLLEGKGRGQASPIRSGSDESKVWAHLSNGDSTKDLFLERTFTADGGHEFTFVQGASQVKAPQTA